MAAAYDTYDYPNYWIGRQYEHEAEVTALKFLLNKIKKLETVVDIGSGYGRLTPAYLHRARKVILTDPSSKLLHIARINYADIKKVKYIQISAANLTKKFKTSSVDLAIMVRVLHHIKDPKKAFEIIRKMLKTNGYFILEFANKNHFKAIAKAFTHGDFTFSLDIFPKDKRSKKSIKKKTLPFMNFHPDNIEKQLKDAGFEIVDKLSVSNARSLFIKSLLSNEILIGLEKYIQKPLSYLNFGPSIFILARKRDI